MIAVRINLFEVTPVEKESQGFLEARAKAEQAVVSYKSVTDRLNEIIGVDLKDRPAFVRALIEDMTLFNIALDTLKRFVDQDAKSTAATLNPPPPESKNS